MPTIETVSASDVAALFLGYVGVPHLDALEVTATKLNEWGWVLAGTTDAAAPWTTDDVQQCLDLHFNR